MTDTPAPYAASERAPIGRSYLDTIERDILARRHIERYMGIAQYVYGDVIDCACGTGYGSYLLSKKDDVRHVYGYDLNCEAIGFASREFGSPKTTFRRQDLNEINQPADCLVSLETIEHLDDTLDLARLCDRCSIQEVILSFPTKKSTNYNKFHRWDLTEQAIREIFANFEVVDSQQYGFDT